MPTYQYACTACDHRFEAVQSFSDPSLSECPACAGMLRKVFSSVGIVFKGSGFYRTDSRAGSTVTNGENGSKNGSSDKGGSDNGGSDRGGSDRGGSDKTTSSSEKSTGSDKKSSTTSSTSTPAPAKS